jgi:thiol-disulfide isomerase/thioredoxin
MRPLLIAVALLLALAAGLAGLVLAISPARVRLVHAASHMLSPSGAPKAGSDARQEGDENAADALVIHLASNPAPAPPFLVDDLDGIPVSTAQWRGKVVLLTFWATWCPPCRDEIPELIDLQARYKDQLQVIGVSLDDAPPQEVREFAKEAGINYPVIMASHELIAEYGGVPALPTSFVVNTDGRIAQKNVGLYPQEVYEAEVRALLHLPVKAKVETFVDQGQIFLKNVANATELPGVDFTGLTPEQKTAVLKRMNSELCTCGCRLTIAQCRVSDSNCATSKKLAAQIVQEVLAAARASSGAAPSGSHAASAAAPAPATTNP